MKNVTITLDPKVARWARIHAARHDVSLSRMVGRMLERGTENGDDTPAEPAPVGAVVAPRFARDDSHFAVRTADDEAKEVAG